MKNLSILKSSLVTLSPLFDISQYAVRTAEDFGTLLLLRSVHTDNPSVREKCTEQFMHNYVAELSIDTHGEYIEEKESVRPVPNLHARMHGNKHIYGLINPLAINSPLVFCSAALIAQDHLSPDFADSFDRPGRAIPVPRTAVFYSIVSPNKGLNLAGLFLKDLVKALRNEYPTLRNFVTFSPIPLLSKDFKEMPSLDQVRNHLVTTCPVYRFHVTHNKAVLDKVMMDADRSDLGMKLSFGWQASYKYS